MIMKRVIKFRGKSYCNKQWVYGLLSIDTDLDTCIEGPTYSHEVEPDTIGQYVGRKDCTGKEIYEGDIISIGNETLTSNQPILDLVEYKENRMAFCLCNVEHIKHPVKFMDYFFLPSELWLNEFGKDIKVVGNIYDNPELLKE